MEVRDKLKGRHIYFLGSSVTYGSGAGGVSFAEHLAEEYGCICTKEAVSGTTLVDNGPDSYISRMKAHRAETPVDLFVCQLSTNDATRKEPLGTPGCGVLSTVAGAMEHIISWAGKTYGCPVVFYTNPRYDSSNYAAMVDLLHKLQEKHSIGILDLWNDETVNEAVSRRFADYMCDPIHPTAQGYRELWTPIFARSLARYL